MTYDELIAVAIKASELSNGAISSWGLRIAVAIGVAIGIALGCFRIVTGIPIHYFIISGYVVVVVQTLYAPRMIIPLAYDSGGVTTSTVVRFADTARLVPLSSSDPPCACPSTEIVPTKRHDPRSPPFVLTRFTLNCVGEPSS